MKAAQGLCDVKISEQAAFQASRIWQLTLGRLADELHAAQNAWGLEAKLQHPKSSVCV